MYQAVLLFLVTLAHSPFLPTEFVEWVVLLDCRCLLPVPTASTIDTSGLRKATVAPRIIGLTR
jgi:hypothetical protein